jgi:hypothetical protein
MKTIIRLLSLSFLTLTFSCNKIDSNIPENFSLDYYTTFEYNTKGKLIFEKGYSNKDSLLSIKTTQYNNNGQMVKEIDWRPEIGLFAFYTYTYDSVGRKTSQKIYDENSKLLGKWVYNYNEKTNCITNINYNKKNEIRDKYEYCYDSVSKTSITTNLDSTNHITGYNWTVWLNKNTSKTTSLENKKSRLEYLDFYDKNKHLRKRIRYNENFKIEATLVWEPYKNEKNKSCTFLDSSNQITSYALEKYNHSDQLIRTDWYHLKGEN